MKTLPAFLLATSAVISMIPSATEANLTDCSFKDFIKKLENPSRVGWNTTKLLWFPHESPEGGAKTIAWGHKIASKHEAEALSKGITMAEADAILASDISRAELNAKMYVRMKYGKDVWDKELNTRQRELLTELVFNVGSLQKFPKATEAIVHSQWDVAKAEIQRFYTNAKGHRVPLTSRNEAIASRYFSSYK